MTTPFRRPAIRSAALAGLLAIGGCAATETDPAEGLATETSAPAPGAANAPVPADDVPADLIRMMTGPFSSAAHAAADPEYFDIFLGMRRIQSDRPDAVWLYVEQAAQSARSEPYRQRVYRLTALDENTVESAVYTFPGDPLKWTGAWNLMNPNARDPFDAFDLDDLVERDGCAVILHRQPDGSWEGSTDGDACGSTLRGAAYATSIVRVHPGGITSWDQGFDADGNQVWGAEKGPYRFERIVQGASMGG